VFDDLCRRFGVGEAIASADVLLAITVEHQESDVKDATIFCDMKEAMGQRRQHKPHQTLAMLHHVEGGGPEAFEGLVLEYAVEPLKRPLNQPRSPMDRLTLGRLQAVTEQELAKRLLLEVFAPAGPLDTSVQRVVIRKLLFRDTCLRRVTTTGLDTAFEAVCVEVPSTQAAAEAQLAERARRKHTPAAQAARERPAAVPGAGTDFLASLDSARHKHRRGQRKASTRGSHPLLQAQGPPGPEQRVDVLAALGFDVDDDLSGSAAGMEGGSNQ
jgi:hypothetical protein